MDKQPNTNAVAPQSDVVVSSRIRLARNYRDIPFPPSMNDVWAAEVIRRAADAVARSPQASAFRLVRMADQTETQSAQLVERHLISRDLAGKRDLGAALLSSGETLSIMINEEDHLRIQALLPGLQLELVTQMAFEADEWLDSQAEYAFDEQWGYLTSCPTNTGTGMRASVMLHLPALAGTGLMSKIVNDVARIGLTVRGLYGEGSEAQGNLFQLSNQITLGRTEEDIVRALAAACQQVVEHERALRQALRKKDALGMEDTLMRSLGVLQQARRIDTKEFMKHWSALRMAAALGYLQMEPQSLDKLMTQVQPASLSMGEGREMDTAGRDMLRATRLRAMLKGM